MQSVEDNITAKANGMLATGKSGGTTQDRSINMQ